MDCILSHVEAHPFGHLHRCTICTRRHYSIRAEPWKIHRPCPGVEVDDDYKMPDFREPPVVVPNFGPGTELTGITSELGLAPKTQCQCGAKAAWMNRWGVEGCRERRNTILGWLRDSQQWYGPEEKAAAAYNALKAGLAFKLNPLDLFGSMVDLAIERAAAKLPPA